MTSRSEWERVDEETGFDGELGTVTERLPVPGGWIYRSRTDTYVLSHGRKIPTGAITVSHGFVPTPAVSETPRS